MKKVVLSLSLILMSVSVLFSQNYYINEDFNSGVPSTWTNTAVSGSFPWMNGIMQDVTDNVSASFDGTPMMYFNDDSLGTAHTDNTVELLSPVVTPLTGFPLTLEFDYNFRDIKGPNDYLRVELHDGTSWTTLLNVTADDCGRWLGPCETSQSHAAINLDQYTGLPLQLKFTYHDGSDWAYWAAFDNVQLWSPHDFDLDMISINTPFSNCGLTAQESVNVTIKNIGFSSVANFPISYSIDNGAPVTETITDSIHPGSTYTYTFTQGGNFSTVDVYELEVYTRLASDLDRGNDTLLKIVENIAPVVPDYYQDFESGATDWSIYGSNSSLEIDTPSANIISSTPNGGIAAVSNANGSYNNNELSYLQAPCMDFGSAPGAPIMDFLLNYDLDPGDQLWMEESYDGGVTWSKLDAAVNSNNWYNNTQANVWEGSSSGWVRVDNVLEDAYRNSKKDQLKFRFVLSTDGSGTAEGFAVDDFSINNPRPDDVKMTKVISPDASSTCGFRNEQDIIVEVFNQGFNTATSLIFSYQITSGPNGPSAVVSDTNNLTIPPNSPYLLVHDIPADLGDVGSYVMDFWIEVPNDGINSNDSILNFAFDHIAVNNISENFTSFQVGGAATGNGWVSGGTNGYVWKIQDRTVAGSPPTGTASGPLLDHTGDLNGNGKYAYTDVPPLTGVGETATLTSPCMNLGLMDGAVISFWYHKYGSAMGDLFVEVFDPLTDSWIAVNSIFGSTQMSQGAPWKLGSARITTPFSSKVRFRGYSRGNPTGYMAIDDIEIFPPEEIDGMLRNIIEPVTDCDLKSNEKFTVEIANYGKREIDTVPIAYTINSNGVFFQDTVNGVPTNVFRDTAFNVQILPGAILSHTFTNLLDLSDYDQEYTITIWLEIIGEGRRSNDTIVYDVINETQHFPYLETFSDEVKLPNGQFRDLGYFESYFTASPPDAELYSWQLASGSTPSGTGPSSDHTQDSVGLPGGPFPSVYFFVNSNGANPMVENTANLITPCIDLNNTPAANLEFWYYMHSTQAHRLHIDVHNGSFWEEDVYVMTDTFDQKNQGDPWKKRIVTLSKFTGDFVQVRFRAVSPQGAMRPDISLDDIGVVLPEPQQVANEAITDPKNGRCNYWPNEIVKARLRNVGRDNLDSVVMAYKYLHPDSVFAHLNTHPHFPRDPNDPNAPDPNTPEPYIHEHWSDYVYDTVRFADLGMLPIAPGDTRIVAHGVPLDMFGGAPLDTFYGPWKINVKTFQPGDLNALDDELEVDILHPLPEDLPYIVDFESLPRGQILNFPAISWREVNVGGFVWEVDNIDTDPSTGPTYDHTHGNAQGQFLVTIPQPPLFPPSSNGEYAEVETPCLELTDVNHAFLEYYFHRYGNDLNLGNMTVEIFDDTNWIQIARTNGMTQLSKQDDWERMKIDLNKFDHQNARFRFNASHHGVSSHTGLDDIYVGALPEYDLAIDSIVSPSEKPSECYSEHSTIKVRVLNKGVNALDFTVDTLTLTAKIYVGGVLIDTESTIISSNILNPSQMPLLTDSTVIIEVDSLDLSEYNTAHEIIVESDIFRDSINLFNNTLSSVITPTIQAGNMSVLPETICGGATTLLSVDDFQGTLEWQYRRELPGGVVWSPVFPLNGTKDLLVKPSDTTYYRLKYCNASNSDSVLYSTDTAVAALGKDSVIKVNVINTPAPTTVLDTVCEAGQIVLTPGVPSTVDTIHWYNTPWELTPFQTNMSYTGFHRNEPDTFYVESVIDGCNSVRSPVYAVVTPYPDVDLGPDTTICPDSLYYFNASGGDGYKYEWKRIGDPRPYDSTDNEVQVISINPYDIMEHADSNATSTTISLSVIVTSPYNCVSYDTASITVLHKKDTSLCITGLEQLALNNAISLHPNPTSGKVQISINLQNSDDASYEIFSIDGKAIKQRKTIPTSNYVEQVDLSNLSNGVYFVKLITDQGTVVKKLVLTN